MSENLSYTIVLTSLDYLKDSVQSYMILSSHYFRCTHKDELMVGEVNRNKVIANENIHKETQNLMMFALCENICLSCIKIKSENLL